ncbi:hypothetical protein ASPWEDRAFT_41637 [Aspergillus wentii DTO 134E9]|uniref:Nucleolar protein 16 n=1 Tax=Aspergillus wentii DTO 134E9 TaxID=1073089 RepID=A0A1L9RFW3_ASPWE|nr:uncharacterized protein ASPWEDRAFT_41637 [Aspergillus wentii DTO 134E9]KAI9925526.1 Nucleolar protein 16 [Aspergillus wentii]OJJ33767.1 hypothetical protein ASPWEDRAFT_41637 [Aspergillus wentii DTO 134E9]
MGRILQKKKLRSGLTPNRPKKNLKRKDGHKKVNVLGNAIIAENWDRKLTLTQNYRRLGLVHRLNAPTGGSEKRPTKTGVEVQPKDSLHIRGSGTADAQEFALGETKVERDPETGKIIRVVRDEDNIEVAGRTISRANPLNDPLNDLSDGESRAQPQKKNKNSDVVQKLEIQASKEEKSVSQKKPRHQSQRETEWITRLVERHGDNIGAMVRDRKLNPMQQSEGDIKRRLRKWRAAQ